MAVVITQEQKMRIRPAIGRILGEHQIKAYIGSEKIYSYECYGTIILTGCQVSLNENILKTQFISSLISSPYIIAQPDDIPMPYHPKTNTYFLVNDTHNKAKCFEDVDVL